MSAIFKVAYNPINAYHTCEGEGKPPKEPDGFWFDDEMHEARPKPVVYGGAAQETETVAADSVEDAIAIVRKAKVGNSWWCETDCDSNGDGLPDEETRWLHVQTIDIAVVRVEPVAFTTI